MIVAQLQAGGGVLGERTEALAHRLPDRLERLEAVGAAAGVQADALGRAVVDGHEHRDLAWPSPVITEVRSVPHIRSTRSVVIVPSWALGPRGRPAR